MDTPDDDHHDIVDSADLLLRTRGGVPREREVPPLRLQAVSHRAAAVRPVDKPVMAMAVAVDASVDDIVVSGVAILHHHDGVNATDPGKRKLIWYDKNGEEKVARGTGVIVTGSGTLVQFLGDQGDIWLTSQVKFIII